MCLSMRNDSIQQIRILQVYIILLSSSYHMKAGGTLRQQLRFSFQEQEIFGFNGPEFFPVSDFRTNRQSIHVVCQV